MQHPSLYGNIPGPGVVPPQFYQLIPPPLTRPATMIPPNFPASYRGQMENKHPAFNPDVPASDTTFILALQNQQTVPHPDDSPHRQYNSQYLNSEPVHIQQIESDIASGYSRNLGAQPFVPKHAQQSQQMFPHSNDGVPEHYNKHVVDSDFAHRKRNEVPNDYGEHPQSGLTRNSHRTRPNIFHDNSTGNFRKNAFPHRSRAVNQTSNDFFEHGGSRPSSWHSKHGDSGNYKGRGNKRQYQGSRARGQNKLHNFPRHPVGIKHETDNQLEYYDSELSNDQMAHSAAEKTKVSDLNTSSNLKSSALVAAILKKSNDQSKESESENSNDMRVNAEGDKESENDIESHTSQPDDDIRASVEADKESENDIESHTSEPESEDYEYIYQMNVTELEQLCRDIDKTTKDFWGPLDKLQPLQQKISVILNVLSEKTVPIVLVEQMKRCSLLLENRAPMIEAAMDEHYTDSEDEEEEPSYTQVSNVGILALALYKKVRLGRVSSNEITMVEKQLTKCQTDLDQMQIEQEESVSLDAKESILVLCNDTLDLLKGKEIKAAKPS